MNTQDTLIAYTDGACSGNPGPGGWAFMLGDLRVSELLPWTTNNFAELFAVYKLLEYAEPGVHLHIVTDSKLVIGWLNLGWRRNVLIIDELVDLIFDVMIWKNLFVTFQHCQGHSRTHGNNVVDQLARKEAQVASYLSKAGKL